MADLWAAVAGAVAGGLSGYLASVALLRGSERRRHRRDLAFSMRRLRVIALEGALDLLGRYHNLKNRRLLLEATHVPATDVERARNLEKVASGELTDLLGRQRFLLLGEPLATLFRDAFGAMERADSADAVGRVATEFHEVLSRWIPPLEPVTSATTSSSVSRSAGNDEGAWSDFMSRVVRGPGSLPCSFCGKMQQEVRKLIKGPEVNICDECVDLCHHILAEESQGGQPHGN